MGGLRHPKRSWQTLNTGAVTEHQAGGEAFLLHGRSEAGWALGKENLIIEFSIAWLECVCRHARGSRVCAQQSACIRKNVLHVGEMWGIRRQKKRRGWRDSLGHRRLGMQGPFIRAMV